MANFMTRPALYGDKKQAAHLSLTPEALKWLSSQKLVLAASSLSDVIEKLARLPKS